MPKVLPNITYDNVDGAKTVDSPSSMYKLPFERDEEYFSNLDSRTRFLKGCEKLREKGLNISVSLTVTQNPNEPNDSEEKEDGTTETD